jgi:type IV pilus biogenesis protein CpaD/CtpE
MKVRTYLSGAGVLLAVLIMGCASKSEEGVKSDYRTQWTMVAADTKTTTDAAKSVLSASDLKDVTASSTDVDGVASGLKADGTKVAVVIAKTDNGSKVSVTVGEVGDPTLGASYAAQIKLKAESK